MTTLAAIVRKDAQYVETHVDAGHADPSDPKFDDFLTDLDTFVKNANRLRYQYHPPATIEERLSFLVLHADLLEKLVTQGSLDANAAVKAAADRVITAIGDVSALKAERDAAQAAQATAEANAAASALAATNAAAAQAVAEAASAQAATDLVTANANLAATQAALDAALADAAADVTTNADTTATANTIAVTPV